MSHNGAYAPATADGLVGSTGMEWPCASREVLPTDLQEEAEETAERDQPDVKPMKSAAAAFTESGQALVDGHTSQQPGE
jgi:hypothetical protein